MLSWHLLLRALASMPPKGPYPVVRRGVRSVEGRYQLQISTAEHIIREDWSSPLTRDTDDLET